MRVAVLAPGGCGGVCEGGGPSRESVEDNDALDMRDSVLAVRLISSGGQAACEPMTPAWKGWVRLSCRGEGQNLKDEACPPGGSGRRTMESTPKPLVTHLHT